MGSRICFDGLRPADGPRPRWVALAALSGLLILLVGCGSAIAGAGGDASGASLNNPGPTSGSQPARQLVGVTCVAATGDSQLVVTSPSPIPDTQASGDSTDIWYAGDSKGLSYVGVDTGLGIAIGLVLLVSAGLLLAHSGRRPER